MTKDELTEKWTNKLGWRAEDMVKEIWREAQNSLFKRIQINMGVKDGDNEGNIPE